MFTNCKYADNCPDTCPDDPDACERAAVTDRYGFYLAAPIGLDRAIEAAAQVRSKCSVCGHAYHAGKHCWQAVNKWGDTCGCRGHSED